MSFTKRRSKACPNGLADRRSKPDMTSCSQANRHTVSLTSRSHRKLLRTPLCDLLGRADELGCCTSELGEEMVAAVIAGNGQEDVPVARRPTGCSGDVLPVGEIVRRSLAQAEDALARLQNYRAVRCGLADSSSGRHT
jgi:hypothetical protein